MKAYLVMKKGTEVISLKILFEDLIKPGNQVPTKKPLDLTNASYI
jgi:hypothetical protein